MNYSATFGRLSESAEAARAAMLCGMSYIRTPLTLILGASCLLAWTATASVADPNSSLLTPAERTHIHDICLNVMHIPEGNSDFDGCKSSLASSLGRAAEVQTAKAERAMCAQKGFAPGSTDFDVCVVNATPQDAPQVSLSRDPHIGAATGVADTSGDAGAGATYYNRAPHVRYQWERLSCAQLGFDPDSAEFGSCVADLDLTLFEADHGRI